MDEDVTLENASAQLFLKQVLQLGFCQLIEAPPGGSIWVADWILVQAICP
jgi:hypothetical protein